MCHCTFVIVCEVSVNGVGVQTARLSVSSWHWLTDNEEGSVLSTLTICQALPPRCFTMLLYVSRCARMRPVVAWDAQLPFQRVRRG